MDRSLQPLTEPGRRFVALAEHHAEHFASRAEEHDKLGSLALENIRDLQASRCLAACISEELGGWNLTSLHDLVAGVSRFGRGDGSIAIAVNMHLATTWTLSYLHRHMKLTGDEERRDHSTHSFAGSPPRTPSSPFWPPRRGRQCCSRTRKLAGTSADGGWTVARPSVGSRRPRTCSLST